MHLREKIFNFCFLCICLIVINNSEAKKSRAEVARHGVARDIGSKAMEMCQKYTKEACAGNFTPFVGRRRRSIFNHGEASLAKVIGGRVINDSKLFPHMATLGNPKRYREWYCGASLISEDYLVTAAQCLDKKKLEYVRLGDADLRQSYDDMDVIVAKVLETIYHPWYSKANLKYYFADIALIRIEPITKFTQNVRPICLWTKDTIESTRTLAVTGWGRKNYDDGDASSKIRAAEIKQMDDNLCRGRGFEFDDRNMICAGVPEGGKDTCEGDEGGPLQTNYAEDLGVASTCDPPILALVGVASNVEGCGEPFKPNSYTKISYYLRWIENQVWKTTN